MPQKIATGPHIVDKDIVDTVDTRIKSGGHKGLPSPFSVSTILIPPTIQKYKYTNINANKLKHYQKYIKHYILFSVRQYPFF